MWIDLVFSEVVLSYSCIFMFFTKFMFSLITSTFFSAFISFPSPAGTKISCILDLLILSHRTLRVILSNLFFPCCYRKWINSVDLFASSLTFSSVTFIVLLRSSYEFLCLKYCIFSSKIL